MRLRLFAVVPLAFALSCAPAFAAGYQTVSGNIGSGPLKLGDRGPAVTTLQGDLLQFGYSQVGSASGRFNQQTQSALIAFQKAMGLSPTGIMNGATFAAILKKGEWSDPNVVTGAIGSAPLHLGQVGAAVTMLQGDLLQFGYSQVGSAYGFFNQQTQSGLMAFQRSMGVPASGILDAATFQALVKKGGWTATSTGNVGTQSGSGQTPSGSGGTSNSGSGQASTATLSQLQSALSADGYPPGPINGTLDSLTQSAMNAFEAAEGLSQGTTVSQLLADAQNPKAPSHQMMLGYYVKGGSSMASLQAHLSDITAIAPLWYTINTSGTVIHHGSGDVQSLTAYAHTHGKKVYAIVTNLGQNSVILNSASVRARAVNNLVAVVKQSGIDGVNIDFEGINGHAAAGLVDFVRAVHAQLEPLGRLTTVDVGARANASLPLSDPTDAYSYHALGQAADRVAIMTYDQHGPGTGAGPVAGYPWVSRVIQYAIQRIPANKILLGIADYGYNFSGGGAVTIGAGAAESLARSMSVPVQWSAQQQSPYFTYTYRGVRHTVWFSNARAIGVRLALVHSYGLDGVAMWVLGSEDQNTFTTLQQNLNILP